ECSKAASPFSPIPAATSRRGRGPCRVVSRPHGHICRHPPKKNPACAGCRSLACVWRSVVLVVIRLVQYSRSRGARAEPTLFFGYPLASSSFPAFAVDGFNKSNTRANRWVRGTHASPEAWGDAQL